MVIAQVGGIYTSQAAQRLAALPPQPNQSTISCHDQNWASHNLTTVSGSLFHNKLAPYIKNVLHDSAKQGLELIINSGYRDCPLQQELRLQACGDLNKKPIKNCTPPTEPAGRSLHNEGLAVDFACGGYAFFETSPCYGWLKQRAHFYALFEHELEPWHWSTTGK